MEAFDNCRRCGKSTNVRGLEGMFLYPERYPRKAPLRVYLCNACRVSVANGEATIINGEKLHRDPPTSWI